MNDPRPSSPSPSLSKLPKFLQPNLKQRSSSRTDPISPSSKSRKFVSGQHASDPVDDPPVIVEPVPIPRPRTRSERTPELYASTSRISDRLSGWFHHTFNTSSTDLSALLANQALAPASSTRPAKGPNPLLMAAKHGKGHLDKAVRYLLDSDALPDKSTDPIWLLGLHHPGYDPPPPSPLPEKKRRSSASPPVSYRSSSSSTTFPDSPLSQSTSSLAVSSQKKLDPSAHWPPAFYLDFTSRIWLTYRSQFSIPIRDIRLGDLTMADTWEAVACPNPGSSSSISKRSWPWGGDKIWTTDSGWGCMLRTGQSLLANALIHTLLGRDWRRPPCPVHTADYATYVQILTWFFDTPSPEAPFSVHRMALAGKEFGTDVGQWFGPSVAAGAIRTLVSQFPECGLAVAVATDSTLYQTHVFTASHGDSNATYRSPQRHYMRTWGDRPVLLLLGIRLGIEGVNPIYYDTIKKLYEFPQSVGIAGGRPSSSYYFVGSQADNLFYLDPHHARPAIQLRSPPSPALLAAHERKSTTDDSDVEKRHSFIRKEKKQANSHHHSRGATSSTSRSSASSSSSQHYYPTTPPPPPHAPLAPSPLQQEFSSSSADSAASYSTASTGLSFSGERTSPPPPLPPPPSYSPRGRWRSASQSQSLNVSSPRHSTCSDSAMMTMAAPGGEELDLEQQHYCTAYRVEELKTFHCDRVRKMPLSGLDPSMLIGFLCRDEADWWDFRRRVGELPRTIFSVQEEPPTWPTDSDDNMGLESMSEPDDIELEDDDEEAEAVEGNDENEDEPFFDTQSVRSSSSRAGRSASDKGNKSEDVDTEDDPVGPITPGPSKFEFVDRPDPGAAKPREEGEQAYDVDDDDGGDGEDDIEDDWADPLALDSNPDRGGGASPSPPSSSSSVPPLAKSRPSSSSIPRMKAKSSKKEQPVPVPSVQQQQQQHYPFPVTPADEGSASSATDGVGRSRQSSATRVARQQQAGYRMHTARARDGGRTQSGGVKGVLFSEHSSS